MPAFQPLNLLNVNFIGTKVILNSLLHEGDFLGEIIAVTGQDHKGRPICRVKLECQEKPVAGVLYFDSEPAEVHSTLLQVCYPIPKLSESLATLERHFVATAITVAQDAAVKEDQEIMGVGKQDDC